MYGYFVKLVTEEAAKIASKDNGLPRPSFRELAEHVLDHLVCYHATELGSNPDDVDYLARVLQAVFDNAGPTS